MHCRMPPRVAFIELLERTLGINGIRRKTFQELKDLAVARGVEIPEGMLTHDRQDKVEHYAHKKGVVDRSVKKKLNGVCIDQPLKEFIQRSVAAMTQMAVEATRLCNLHVLRTLEDGDPVVIADATFFRQALCLVSEAQVGRRVKDMWLEETFILHYLPSRPRDLPVPRRDGLTQAVTILSQQMYSNAKVMVSFRLYGRLRKLMKLFVVRATLKGGEHVKAFESSHSYKVDCFSQVRPKILLRSYTPLNQNGTSKTSSNIIPST
jgi:hypothetical protein